jgi:ribosomal protein L40E
MHNSGLRVGLVVALLALAALYGSVSVALGQSIRTVTTTQIISTTSTNAVTVMTTSPAIVYTTVTESLNSTVSGTLTTTLAYLTTVTTTIASAVNSTVTETTTYTLTSVSTVMMQILGNTWGEWLTLIVVIVAVASLVVPKVRARRPSGVVCGNCGTRNPPFAKAHCVKCGEPLKKK